MKDIFFSIFILSNSVFASELILNRNSFSKPETHSVKLDQGVIETTREYSGLAVINKAKLDDYFLFDCTGSITAANKKNNLDSFLMMVPKEADKGIEFGGQFGISFDKGPNHIFEISAAINPNAQEKALTISFKRMMDDTSSPERVKDIVTTQSIPLKDNLKFKITTDHALADISCLKTDPNKIEAEAIARLARHQKAEYETSLSRAEAMIERLTTMGADYPYNFKNIFERLYMLRSSINDLPAEDRALALKKYRDLIANSSVSAPGKRRVESKLDPIGLEVLRSEELGLMRTYMNCLYSPSKMKSLLSAIHSNSLTQDQVERDRANFSKMKQNLNEVLKGEPSLNDTVIKLRSKVQDWSNDYESAIKDIDISRLPKTEINN